MKKNGYTVIELVILLFLMAVTTVIFLTKTSYAFKDDNDQVRYNQTKIIIAHAKAYGETIIDELKTNGNKTIIVQTLVDNNFLQADEKGNVVAVDDKTKILNNEKIELRYDQEQDLIMVIYPK